jgi:hypothetical protein
MQLGHDRNMIEAKPELRLSDLYNSLGWVLLVQIVLLALTALLLDGGYSAVVCGSAMTGYWLMVGWLALRRRQALTKTDVILIRAGFVGWLIITFLVQIVLESF